jgi:hypothetical protein
MDRKKIQTCTLAWKITLYARSLIAYIKVSCHCANCNVTKTQSVTEHVRFGLILCVDSDYGIKLKLKHFFRAHF